MFSTVVLTQNNKQNISEPQLGSLRCTVQERAGAWEGAAGGPQSSSLMPGCPDSYPAKLSLGTLSLWLWATEVTRPWCQGEAPQQELPGHSSFLLAAGTGCSHQMSYLSTDHRLSSLALRATHGWTVAVINHLPTTGSKSQLFHACNKAFLYLGAFLNWNVILQLFI